MSKNTTIFECSNCGYQSPRWQGRCPECSKWDTFQQEQAPSAQSVAVSKAAPGKVINLAEFKDNQKTKRTKTGIDELDNVLGGGLVQGSLIMLGGDPGIGKSTLALDAALNLSKSGEKVLYISGEESAIQIKDREGRLNKNIPLDFLAETNLEVILSTLEKNNYTLAVIDSIQTIFSNEVNGVTGGVSQIVYATNALMKYAKGSSTSLVLIGHVTKEGILAGPRTLEHMVDVVLYLEGERYGMFRLLRGVKNRFGSVGEVGLFEMTGEGLKEVLNPSAMFLEGRSSGKSGSCVSVVLEGNKVLLVEVQALVSKSSGGYPARRSSGFDANRLQLILAIMQKHLELPIQNFDVYLNVAGGIKLEERAGDLSVVMAVLSSFYNQAVPDTIAAYGEVGLGGEIRQVSSFDKRKKEATKLGFTKTVSSKEIKSIKDLGNYFR